jgi:hypothetical protein
VLGVLAVLPAIEDMTRTIFIRDRNAPELDAEEVR